MVMTRKVIYSCIALVIRIRSPSFVCFLCMSINCLENVWYVVYVYVSNLDLGSGKSFALFNFCFRWGWRVIVSRFLRAIWTFGLFYCFANVGQFIALRYLKQLPVVLRLSVTSEDSLFYIGFLFKFPWTVVFLGSDELFLCYMPLSWGYTTLSARDHPDDWFAECVIVHVNICRLIATKLAHCLLTSVMRDSTLCLILFVCLIEFSI